MSNTKISALTSATTPLAGTEVVPVVQSGATVKATIANIVGAGTSLVWGTSGWFTSRTAPSSGVGVEVFSSGGNGQILAFNRSTVAYTSLIYDANYHQWNISGVVAAYLDASKNLNIASGNIIPTTAAKGINFTANTPAAGMTSQLLNWYEEGTWTPNQGAGLTIIGAFSSQGKYTRIGRQVTVIASLVGATSIAAAAGGVLSSNLPFTSNATVVGAVMNDGTVGSDCYAFIGSTTAYAVQAVAATTTIYFTCIYFV